MRKIGEKIDQTGRPWTEAEFGHLVKCLKKFTTFTPGYNLFLETYSRTPHAARHKLHNEGMSIHSLYAPMVLKPIEQTINDKKNKEYRLEKRVVELEKENRLFGSIQNILHGKRDVEISRPIVWKKPLVPGSLGWAFIEISDIHYDEKVDPAQVGFLNKYNKAIAKRRLEHVAKRTIELCWMYKNKKFDGLVVAGNGDWLSGWIHEELEKTAL
jgi:hypothetical protein